MIKESGRKGYVLNEEKRELLQLEPLPFSKLNSLKNAAVLIEDIHNLSPANFALVQRCANYFCRHSDISPLILITHSATKTGLYGLAQHMTHVYISCRPGNVLNFGKILDMFRFPKSEKAAHLAYFKTCSSPWGFLIFDVESLTFKKQEGKKESTSAAAASGGAAAADVDTFQERRMTAEKYLTLFCSSESKQAIAIADLILAKVPLSSVDPDLNLSLKSKNSGMPVRINLLDFIASLLSRDDKPTPEIIAFSKYLSKYVRLPRLMVKNKYLA